MPRPRWFDCDRDGRPVMHPAGRACRRVRAPLLSRRARGIAGAGVVARVNTVAFQGIDVLAIDVQVQMTGGLPGFTIVGLPDKAVGESRERVRSAPHALGLALPPKRITVNLAPADLLKEGSPFDLPIADRKSVV